MTCCNDIVGPFDWYHRLLARLTPVANFDENADGWFDGMDRIPARYAGGRLIGDKVNAIVLHSGVSGNRIAPYFANSKRKVSANFEVTKDGDCVQCVPFTRKAWHAGKWNGRSIGIEHQGPNDAPPSEIQAQASLELIRSLLLKFPRIQTIVSHAAIQANRTDPKHYRWDLLEGLGCELVY